MAVTLTQGELSAAIRLGDSAEEIAEATRLLAYVTEAITRHLADAYDTAPEAIVNEAAIRLAGYLFDQPNAGRGLSFANAGRNSGAWAILLPYRVHRAGSTGEAVAAAQEAVGTTGNPVINVAVVGADLVITFDDGTTRDETLPAGMTGDGTDQTARDAAADAQATADGATTSAANAQAAANSASDAAAAAQGTADNAATAATAAADTANANTGRLDALVLEVSTAEIRFLRSTPLVEIDSQQFTNAVWSNLQRDGADVVCPTTGQLEFFMHAKTGGRDNSIAFAKIPAAELRATPTDGEMQVALGANRWFGIRTNSLAAQHIQLKGQDGQASVDGNYSVRISHIEEVTETLVTGVTSGGGGA